MLLNLFYSWEWLKSNSSIIRPWKKETGASHQYPLSSDKNVLFPNQQDWNATKGGTFLLQFGFYRSESSYLHKGTEEIKKEMSNKAGCRMQHMCSFHCFYNGNWILISVLYLSIVVKYLQWKKELHCLLRGYHRSIHLLACRNCRGCLLRYILIVFNYVIQINK